MSKIKKYKYIAVAIIYITHESNIYYIWNDIIHRKKDSKLFHCGICA